MKHKIKKFNNWRAGCSRPGCQASLEGGIVEEMNQKELDDFFTNDCPAVFNSKKRSMTHEESINYLLRYATKEIKSWQKLIDYWSPKEKELEQ